MWNFVKRGVATSIHADCTSNNGREVEELLVGKSFMPSSFHSPPIHITVSFSVSVEICAIRVNTKSGQHETIKFSLYCSSTPVQLHQNYTPGPDNHDFHFIGTFENPPESGEWLIENKFSEKYAQLKARDEAPMFEDFSGRIESLPRHSPNLFRARAFRIKLLRASKSRICPINKLEIWGILDRAKTPSADIDRFIENYSLAASTRESDLPASGGGLLREIRITQPPVIEPLPSVEHIQDELEKYNVPIPNQYIDPITQMIMVNPVLLPSKNIIDASTLEKHFRNTSADPFTGLSMRYDDAIPHLATRFAIEKFIREQNAFLKESSLPVGAKRKERQQDPEERASKKFSPAPVIDLTSSP